MKEQTSTGWFARVRPWLGGFGSLALLGVVAVLVVVPMVMGGMTLTIRTGSMQPEIMPGDVVVTKGIQPADAADIPVGAVIVFLPYPDNPTLIAHRVVSKTLDSKGYSFVTKGDDNNGIDTWGPVRDYQIRGQVLYVVPKIGYAKQWLGSYAHWVAPAFGVVLLGYAAIAFGRCVSTSAKESKARRAAACGAASEASPCRYCGAGAPAAARPEAGAEPVATRDETGPPAEADAEPAVLQLRMPVP